LSLKGFDLLQSKFCCLVAVFAACDVSFDGGPFAWTTEMCFVAFQIFSNSVRVNEV